MDPPRDPFPRPMDSKTTCPKLSPVERALRDSLKPSEFRDVHLYAFSRRTTFQDGPIRIDRPLPVVAIGSILKDTEYFSNREYAHMCWLLIWKSH